MVKLCRGEEIFIECCKISNQAKVDGTHCVDYWVRGTNNHKYLSHRAGILLHNLLVDGMVVGIQGDCTELVRKDL